MRSRPTGGKWALRSTLFIVAVVIALMAASAVALAQAPQMDPPTMVPGIGATVDVSWLPVAPVGSGPTTYTLTWDTVLPFVTPHTVVTNNTNVTINGVDGLTYFAVIQADDGSGISIPSVESQQLADGVPPVSGWTTSLASVLGLNGWYTSAGASISIVDTGTGLNTFFVDGVDVSTAPGFVLGFPPPAPSSYLVPLVQGDHTYQFSGVDVAGNTETAKTMELKLDSVVPTCTLSVSSAVTSSPVTATIGGTDAVPGSGVDHIEYVFLPQGQTPNGSTVWTTVAGASASPSAPIGHFTLFARVLDVAGNVSAVQSADTNFVTTAFTITPSAGSGGSISPATPQTVAQGADSTFTITPNTGFHIADVVVDLASVGTTSSYTFHNVQADHTIAASFAIDTFTLSYTAGANGSIVGSATQVVNYNGSGTSVTASPTVGYHFVSWSDGVLTATRTDSAVKANVSVTANFAINTFTLTYTAGANGSIVGSATQVVNYNGSGASVTATPNVGYHFTGWSDGVLTAARTDSAVKANLSVTANFAINTFTITPSAGPNGSISPSTPQTVNYNGSAAFSITASPGYHVADVLVDGSSVGAVGSYTFTGVTAGHTISASFAVNPPNTFTITPGAGLNGSISPATAQVVDSGANATFTITPSPGYHVADVLVDDSSVGAVASYTFTNVTAAHTIFATFAADSYSIVSSAGAHGTISPLGVQSVPAGSDITFTITPDPGYRVADVLVDSISAGAVSSYTFHGVAAAHSISVVFTALPNFTILAAAGTGGSITPAGAVSVATGGSAAFTITPSSGYRISSVLVDGASVGAVSNYTFNNVTANHSIAASFAALRATSLTLYSNTYSTRRGRTATLRGTISPRMANRTPIGIYVKKPGSRVYVRLTTRYTLSSAWSYAYRLSLRGSYYFQARYAGSSSFRASNSRVIRITVR